MDNEWVGPDSFYFRPESYQGYQEVTEVYYRVNDIAKLLDNTKIKFNYKYDSKKKTLTFYSGKAYDAKVNDVKVKYTSAELKENKRLGDDYAYLKELSVKSNNKKQDVKVRSFFHRNRSLW